MGKGTFCFARKRDAECLFTAMNLSVRVTVITVWIAKKIGGLRSQLLI